MTWTAERLIAFEERVKEAFLARQVKGPVHLCSTTQAEPLLEIFKDVRPDDWVFSTWRSHWHCLLKGAPEEEVFAAILAGRSMFLQFREHKVFCSAIVGGILPIACGVAIGLKRDGKSSKVWCFVGDATARTGLFHEFAQYASGHGLPVKVIVENNEYCTNSPTQEAWGVKEGTIDVHQYDYNRDVPHVGIGQFVQLD